MENVSGSDPTHHQEVAGIHASTPQLTADQNVRVVPTAQLMSPNGEGTAVDQNEVGWEGNLLQFNPISQEEKCKLNNTENPLAFEEIYVKSDDLEMPDLPKPKPEDILTQKGMSVNTVPDCHNIIPSKQPDNFKELGQLATFLRNSLSAEEHSRLENPVESNVGHERLLHDLEENDKNTNDSVSKVKKGVQNNNFHESRQQSLVSFEKEFISFIGSESSSQPAEHKGSSSEPVLLGANWSVDSDGRRFTTCPVCDRRFYKMHGLAAHHASHTTSVPFSGPPGSHLKSQILAHIRKKEQRKPQKNFGKWFGCIRCSIGFAASGQLKKHRCGPDGGAVPCSGCGRVYKGSGAVSLHMRFHCPLTKSKICDLCGKCFDCPEKLTKHRERHSGSHPYSCLACNSWFKSREALNKHCGKHVAKQQELSANPQSD